MKIRLFFLFQALKALLNYGYLKEERDNNTGGGTRLDSPAVIKSLRDVQRFGGLSVTGKLDRETLKLLSTDRCGLQDPKLNATNDTGALTAGRYYLQGTYWKKKVHKH